MKTIIVIPTYNEAENINKLLSEVFKSLKSVPQHDCHALVVDGNSPDGTASIVKEMSKSNSRIHLLPENQKSGLGSAYIYGFKYAIENMSPDVIIEMDGDLQHNPVELPKFIRKIEEGYDYVIGSRFTKGGSIPKEWGLNRKFWSVGGNIFSKFVLGIFTVSDFTSGYKASRVNNFLNKIDLDSIRSKGFAYKIDLLYRMYKLDAKIAEIPIEFGLRDRGSSKMESNNALDSLKVVLAIRINENQEFFKFLCAGIAGLTTDSLLFNILRITIFDSALSALVSGFIAMMVTFTINNVWSFGKRKISGPAKLAGTFLVYSSLSIIPILFRSQLVDLFVRALGNSFWSANFGFALGVVIGLVWNYLVYSKIIWRKRPAD